MMTDNHTTAPSRPAKVERMILQPEQYAVPKGYYDRSRHMTWLQLLSEEFGEAGIDWSVTNTDSNPTVRFRSDAEGTRWKIRTSPKS